MGRITIHDNDSSASILTTPPMHSILVHACNTQGKWGAGIALAFKKAFPEAFSIYRAHCLSPPTENLALKEHQAGLAGTALLIPPSDDSMTLYWIACLFTSVGYGKQVDIAEAILKNTQSALEHLAAQIEDNQKTADERNVPVMGNCWAVKINSGKFGVEWERTMEVLKKGRVDLTIIDRGSTDERFQRSRGKKRRQEDASQNHGSAEGLSRRAVAKRQRKQA